MDYSLTYKVMENEKHPRCIICFKMMTVESMLPNKMKRHLETVLEILANKPCAYVF